LSIIDLEGGRQPMCNEDQTVSVVFNGEIYNFADLRRDLEKQGHVFVTRCDTEVIVHSYEQYGEACVDRMRGMFVFAIWDERTHKLMIARDRLGKKPLYYAIAGEQLIFGSELKAILQIPEVERRLSWTSIHHYLSTLYTPLKESIVAGIHKLPPGQILTATPSGVQLKTYWDLHFEPDYSKPEEYFCEELRAHLEEAVKLRMMSDVPLGAFLSGGIDSSSVVAMMARLSSRPVKTFSIGFVEPDYNELIYARAVSKRFGTDHQDLTIEPDILGVIDDFAWYLDEPFGDSSAIPTYMVSKLAARSVRVALSGDGGDELFAGYQRYVVEGRERRLDHIPRFARKMAASVGRIMPPLMKGRNFLRHLAYDGIDRYFDAAAPFNCDDFAQMLTPAAYREMQSYDLTESRRELARRQNGHWLSNLQYLDTKLYLPNDILTKVDRMSMAHSLEVRTPLLDHKMVEFAATIPPDLKLRGTTKYILKKALEGVLPNEILYRPKRGFAVPLNRWFRGQLKGYVRDLLLDSTSRERGIVNPGYIERLLQIHERGRDVDLQLWTLISFEMWCRRFLDRRDSSEGQRSAPPHSASG